MVKLCDKLVFATDAYCIIHVIDYVNKNLLTSNYILLKVLSPRILRSVATNTDKSTLVSAGIEACHPWSLGPAL